MASKSKKPNVFSRVLSRFSPRLRGKSAVALAHGNVEGSSTGFGPSSSSHPPTHSLPDLLLPASSSDQSLPPIPQFRNENEIVDSSQGAAMSTHRDGQHGPLRPPQPFPGLQPYDTPPGVHSPTPSFFQGASGFQVKDFNVNVNSAGDKSVDGWELLLKNIAPNALHDSDARYDPPKCDEDTRVEVTGGIMDWIQDRDGPQRLLCMTGAAGSGKSALQQTTAEKCLKNGILGSTFFFSALDSTRNTVKEVIPTIAYQLGETNEALRRCIKAAVERDRLIFSKSLRKQMSTLIVEPSQRCKEMGMDLTTLPYAILIDGLDECMGEDRQEELLNAVRECLLIDGLPFRVFIASRPEWAIRTALEPGGHLCEVAYHIKLSDQYDASADMGRYLRSRYAIIGLRIGNSKWFSEDDIETLVRAASGQFIYVTTVYKYISERRASPAARLKIVLTWTPREGQATRPFEALDTLYFNVLLAAKRAYEAVDSHHGRDFLLLFRVHHIGVTGFDINGPYSSINPPADVLSALLCLEPQAEETLISDLRSLMVLETHVGKLRLRLYHKSFSDFLKEPSRAKDLFVPESRVYTHLAKCFMQHIIEFPLPFDYVPAKWDEVPLPVLYRRSLKEAVEDLPFSLRSAPGLDGHEVVDFTQNGGWQKINNALPLLYREGEWLHSYFQEWIDGLRNPTEHLEAHKPEVAATISVFTEKWINAHKEYKDTGSFGLQ